MIARSRSTPRSSPHCARTTDGSGRAPISSRQYASWSRAATDHEHDPNVDHTDGHRESRVGNTRIQGALAALDHEASRGTIATGLREHRLEPAPDRLKKTTWSEFLKTKWDVLTAADFFTVDAWTCHGLTRFAVLFVIDLSTRRIHIA